MANIHFPVKRPVWPKFNCSLNIELGKGFHMEQIWLSRISLMIFISIGNLFQKYFVLGIAFIYTVVVDN